MCTTRNLVTVSNNYALIPTFHRFYLQFPLRLPHSDDTFAKSTNSAFSKCCFLGNEQSSWQMFNVSAEIIRFFATDLHFCDALFFCDTFLFLTKNSLYFESGLNYLNRTTAFDCQQFLQKCTL